MYMEVDEVADMMMDIEVDKVADKVVDMEYEDSLPNKITFRIQEVKNFILRYTLQN